MHDKTAHPGIHTRQGYHKRMREVAASATDRGMSETAIDALLGIDACTFTWRRRMLKGELVRRLLDALDIDIEQAEFEALTALSRLTFGIGGEPKTGVTIGDIAEEMTIDPSRASRLVTLLVQKGYVRRAIAQDDARKTVLILTGASQALLEAFLDMKWRVVIDAFSGWDEAEIAGFEKLFSKYVETMREAVDGAGGDRTLAADHAQKIRAAAAKELAGRSEFA